MQAIQARQDTKPEAAHSLVVTRRSMDRYLRRFQEAGSDGLYDRRHKNYRKIDEAIQRQSDSVLDGEAAYIFRPQASYYGALVDELRYRFNTGSLRYDIPERCREGGCLVAILDSRMRQMPGEVRQFIDRNYSPTSMKDVLIRTPMPPQISNLDMCTQEESFP